jgi:hypothetical protein
MIGEEFVGSIPTLDHLVHELLLQAGVSQNVGKARRRFGAGDAPSVFAQKLRPDSGEVKVCGFK